MAYLTVHEWDELESTVFSCMFFTLLSSMVTRDRAATDGYKICTIVVVDVVSSGLEQTSKDRMRRDAEKKCQCRRNWTTFSPWYNNINRLTTTREKERETEGEGEGERERKKREGMTLKSTNQKIAVFCSIPSR